MKRWPFVLGLWFFFAMTQFVFYQSSNMGDNFWVAGVVFLTGMIVMGVMSLAIKNQ